MSPALLCAIFGHKVEGPTNRIVREGSMVVEWAECRRCHEQIVTLVEDWSGYRYERKA